VQDQAWDKSPKDSLQKEPKRDYMEIIHQKRAKYSFNQNQRIIYFYDAKNVFGLDTEQAFFL
jgi:hypothetical protein